MNRGLTDRLNTDDVLDNARPATSPTLGVLAVRFVTLLVMIVAAFAWAWSR